MQLTVGSDWCCPQIKLSEYNTLKSQLSAAARKATGSLAVRDIGTMVKPNEVVDSENLTTLFVIVSKFGMQEWTSTYETMSQFVVCCTCLAFSLWQSVHTTPGTACLFIEFRYTLCSLSPSHLLSLPVSRFIHGCNTLFIFHSLFMFGFLR